MSQWYGDSPLQSWTSAGSGTQRGPRGIFEIGHAGPVGPVDEGVGPQHEGFSQEK